MLYKQVRKKNYQTSETISWVKRWWRKKLDFYAGNILLQQGKGSLYFPVQIILQYIYFTVSVILIEINLHLV